MNTASPPTPQRRGTPVLQDLSPRGPSHAARRPSRSLTVSAALTHVWPLGLSSPALLNLLGLHGPFSDEEPGRGQKIKGCLSEHR